MVDLRPYRDPRFSLPAIRVKSSHPEHEQGYIIINESDFDEAKHELWQEPGAKSAEQAKPEPVGRREPERSAANAEHTKRDR